MNHLNTEFNISTENELSVILSHFDYDFIIDIVKTNIFNRVFSYFPTTPNLVFSLEQNFKIIMELYRDREEILNKREMVYKTIIDTLCSNNFLQFTYNEGMDYYSYAFQLYDFLVSKFKFYMITFFTEYINKEKNNLYNGFKLGDLKKNKDSSTLYGKRMYKNQKLAVINANLEYVIDNICMLDITLNELLTIIFVDKNIVKSFEESITPMQDFFKSIYVAYLQNPQIKQSLITDIRLSIHNSAAEV